LIRVGFRLIGGAAWQGGRNYLWNLLYAITAQPARQLQPVLLVRADEDPGDLAMPGVEVVVTDARLDARRARQLGRATKLALRRNPVERALLRRAQIDVLSHAAPIGGRRSAPPTIAWIPDLQHKRLPQLASRFEHAMRDLLFREMLRDAAIVVTSSATAREDLIEFYGRGAERARVLQFVSQPRLPRAQMIPLDALRAKFALPARFFHLPNQLWTHKNHALVVEALRRAPDAVVVATGPREDYRQRGVYDALLARVAAAGVGARFHHLGLVSFPELISLMHHAVAVINPSRFEGWSTTVEEAKSLGKRVLLSDLPVHREQAPARASYFGVDDPDALAALLTAAWAADDHAADAAAADTAAAALAARTAAFAATYEAIVLDAVRGTR
jgi:glycosyltransferase involved in cell wall biosynthesis